MFELKRKVLSQDSLLVNSNTVKRPLVWLESESETAYDKAIYLVNNTGAVLDFVQFSSASMVTLDDKAYGAGADARIYSNVQQGEAVKVEQLDIIFDSDFMITIYMKISSPILGTQDMRHVISKARFIKTNLITAAE